VQFITAQTSFFPVYESCLLTSGRPSLTADRSVTKSVSTNAYTNTETNYSYVHTLNGIRNQESSFVVSVTYRERPKVLPLGLFMIKTLLLLKVISFLEMDFLRNFCKFSDSITAGYFGLCSTAAVFVFACGFAREYCCLEDHRFVVEVPISSVFPSRNLLSIKIITFSSCFCLSCESITIQCTEIYSYSLVTSPRNIFINFNSILENFGLRDAT